MASCDSESGECSTIAADDGQSCDDGDACTGGDRCSAGACVGTSGVLFGDDIDARAIPDGTSDCSGDEPLVVDFDLQPGGTIVSVEVMVEVEHQSLSDLSARIVHVPSGRQAILFDTEATLGTRLSGQYVFAADGAELTESALPNSDLAPSRYVSQDDLASVFGGGDMAGAWRLYITDRCQGSVGEYTRSRLVVFRDCSPSDGQ